MPYTKCHTRFSAPFTDWRFLELLAYFRYLGCAECCQYILSFRVAGVKHSIELVEAHAHVGNCRTLVISQIVQFTHRVRIASFRPCAKAY